MYKIIENISLFIINLKKIIKLFIPYTRAYKWYKYSCLLNSFKFLMKQIKNNVYTVGFLNT